MMYARAIATVVAALCLAGCGSAREIQISTGIDSPPDAWLEPAKPLPPIPECDGRKTFRERVACRAAYDEQSRLQYVELAARHDALAGYTSELVKK